MEDIFKSAVVFKIHNGTARTDTKNLCVSCRFVHHTRGAISGVETIKCAYLYNRPVIQTEPVIECNGFSDRTKPSLDDMRDIAWNLMTSKSGKVLGFERPHKDKESIPSGSPGFMPSQF